MRTNQAKLTSFDYQGGKLVTDRLHKILGTKTIRELGDRLDVSASTIATWHKRGLCPFEIVLRAHMYTGALLKWLTLGEGEPFPNGESQKHQSKRIETKLLFDIDSFIIKNGKLENLQTLTFDKSYLDEIEVSNPMAIREIDCTYLVDKENQQAVSGTYLVDMDGLLSLNQIQRLPGKKLAISFNGSTLTVEEDEVRVVGRVAFVMERR
ncbi:helix-turn-helix domain-containing protein [Vibrio sp. ZSDE26]|uniref:Helix-turn-helix domain-containing protein n=1 Tax=Vibrio amylolyticus TaxID=2847292 RepID=A0A9X1XMP7_9VIBR|nr:helix-turn-helix domain-containing protein [Vibrio amylolyticus]MCK6263770.1 helix-turn-helix domain-containing protein [Vibrio amylolyticus]